MSVVGAAYVNALTELAIEQAIEVDIYEACIVLSGIFKQEPEYLKLLASPAVTVSEKKVLLDQWIGAVPVLLKNSIYLLSDKKEIMLLPQILIKYIENYRNLHNILSVKVISAIPLSPELAEELENVLVRYTGKTILLDNQLEQECIGGLKLEIAGKQYDGSIKARLEQIQQIFSSVKLGNY